MKNRQIVEDNSEEKTSRKLDKNLSKHFTIKLNNKKVKIVNYLIKDYKRNERQGKIIELISKYNILTPTNQKVIIVINHDKQINIAGDWAHASFGNGIYKNGYWINEITES